MFQSSLYKKGHIDQPTQKEQITTVREVGLLEDQITTVREVGLLEDQIATVVREVGLIEDQITTVREVGLLEDQITTVREVCLLERKEKFEDTKVVINRSRNSKKDRQYNGKKDKNKRWSTTHYTES